MILSSPTHEMSVFGRTESRYESFKMACVLEFWFWFGKHSRLRTFFGCSTCFLLKCTCGLDLIDFICILDFVPSILHWYQYGKSLEIWQSLLMQSWERSWFFQDLIWRMWWFQMKTRGVVLVDRRALEIRIAIVVGVANSVVYQIVEDANIEMVITWREHSDVIVHLRTSIGRENLVVRGGVGVFSHFPCWSGWKPAWWSFLSGRKSEWSMEIWRHMAVSVRFSSLFCWHAQGLGGLGLRNFASQAELLFGCELDVVEKPG